jgi:multidrug efflux pump subunit AcrB
VIVSLTLTPMMCSRLLSADGDAPPGHISGAVERLPHVNNWSAIRLAM